MLYEEVWAEPNRVKNAPELTRQIEEVMALNPHEEDVEGPWTQDATNAQNAGMSVAYALRTRGTGEAQEAAWAARVAYEALDNFVINRENIDTNMPGAEQRILSHHLVQAELARQRRDLDELMAAADTEALSVLPRIRDRARAEAATFFGAAS